MTCLASSSGTARAAVSATASVAVRRPPPLVIPAAARDIQSVPNVDASTSATTRGPTV